MRVLFPSSSTGTSRRDDSRVVITANLCTEILDSRGFDSSRILIVRGGILMSIGDAPGILSKRIPAVGMILAGRWDAVSPSWSRAGAFAGQQGPEAGPRRCGASGGALRPR